MRYYLVLIIHNEETTCGVVVAENPDDLARVVEMTWPKQYPPPHVNFGPDASPNGYTRVHAREITGTVRGTIDTEKPFADYMTVGRGA
jgi:hypothetical protein